MQVLSLEPFAFQLFSKKDVIMSRFEELEVWKRLTRLCADMYKAFSSLKDYGFRDQITRSALSVPSNIAEGYERRSPRETANFLNYAKGSAGELRTQVYIGLDIGYISNEQGQSWIKESGEISRMLYGLMKSVRERK